MKEMNTLEAQLHSWTPRHPSPGLERRVLGSEPLHYSLSRLATVLAPTAACLLLTVSMLRQSAPDLLPNRDTQAAMVAMGLSNQNFAAYLPGSFSPPPIGWILLNGQTGAIPLLVWIPLRPRRRPIYNEYG
jgi:hypothetical protein